MAASSRAVWCTRIYMYSHGTTRASADCLQTTPALMQPRGSAAAKARACRPPLGQRSHQHVSNIAAQIPELAAQAFRHRRQQGAQALYVSRPKATHNRMVNDQGDV